MKSIACIFVLSILFVISCEKEPPIAAFTADKTTVTTGETIQFTDQSTNEPRIWDWDFGDEVTSREQNPSHSYTTAGSYMITLTVTNFAGRDSETKSDYITVAPYINGQTGTLSDIEGNTYLWIGIGGQAWMAENLKTTKYNDGTDIPLVTDTTEWDNLTTPGYCWYDNDAATYKDTYGTLYNWYTVNTDKLCPAGWHVPTDEEWTTLITYLGGERVAGGKLKEKGTLHWISPNVGATNETGFTALPGGRRNYHGFFNYRGFEGYWWSATESSTINAWYRGLSFSGSSVHPVYHGKEGGFSIRCLRD